MQTLTSPRSLQQLAAQIRVCTRCPLCASRTNAVPGDGPRRAKVMVIGEAPGREEDKSGHAFVGAAGRFLDQVLEGSGFSRHELFITNIVKCRPPENRTPRTREATICSANYLFEQIELVNPQLIVLLGGVAAKTILGAKNVNDVRGRVIERGGRKYLVSYHPATGSYRQDLAARIREDFAKLRRALELLNHSHLRRSA